METKKVAEGSCPFGNFCIFIQWNVLESTGISFPKNNISYEQFLNGDFKDMKENILDYANNDPYELRYYFWPKQLMQILGKEKYLKYFGGIMGI